MSTARASEFDLIARHFAPLAVGRRVKTYGLTDDAASVITTPGCELVMTADALVRGVHFLPDDPSDLVARKALRSNLSDLAAKGARPLCYLVCLALPKTTHESWIEGFARGLAADQATYDIELAGGDTTATLGELVIAITALGEVAAGRMLRRGAGRIGDEIWVSGTIGDGALGLLAAQGRFAPSEPAMLAALVDRYRLPRPRTTLGPFLADIGVAAMDVSDGLAQDLGHMCRLAGCGAVLDAAAVPLSPAAAALHAQDGGLITTILSGGDDYELLIAAPPEKAGALVEAGIRSGTPVTRIGRLVAGEGVDIRATDGARIVLDRGGWTHF